MNCESVHHLSFLFIVRKKYDPIDFIRYRPEQLFMLNRRVHEKRGVSSKILRYVHLILCLGESMWLDLPIIKDMIKFTRNLFPSIAYAYSSTPTYPCGVNGYLICALDKVSLFLP